MMPRIAALVLATCVLLSGCATTADRYDSETAVTLQGSVLAVTEASAAGDPLSALTRLDELQASLLDAYSAGSVSQSRFDDISAAIDLVRADLELAVSQSVEVVPEDDEVDDAPDDPDDTDRPGNSDKPDKPEKPGKND